MSYLAHPEQHGGPRRLALVGGAGPDLVEKEVRKAEPDVSVPGSTTHFEDRGSVLRDLEVNLFFAHADVFSGQRLGELNSVGELECDVIGETYRLIEEIRFQAPKSIDTPRANSKDVWKNITDQCNTLFNSEDGWSGDASNAARPYYDQMTTWEAEESSTRRSRSPCSVTCSGSR